MLVNMKAFLENSCSNSVLCTGTSLCNGASFHNRSHCNIFCNVANSNWPVESGSRLLVTECLGQACFCLRLRDIVFFLSYIQCDLKIYSFYCLLQFCQSNKLFRISHLFWDDNMLRNNIPNFWMWIEITRSVISELIFSHTSVFEWHLLTWVGLLFVRSWLPWKI